MLVLNKDTLDLIKSFEGFEPKWYPDPAHGWAVPTVGYGHTDAAGEPKFADTKDKVFTEAECVAMLERDLQKYARAVLQNVRVPLNPNQFGALTSWCYNVGPGNVAKSTLVKKLNAGNFGAVPAELAKWNKAGGKVLQGLVRRRKAEAALFRKPVAASAAPPARSEPSPAPVTPPKAPEPAPSVPQPAKRGNGGLIAAIVILIGGLMAWLADIPCNTIGVLCQ